MRDSVRLSIAATVAMLMVCRVSADTLPHATDRVESISQHTQVAGEPSSYKIRRAAVTTMPRSIWLAPVVLQKALAQVNAVPRPGTPHKVGFGRDIPDLADATVTAEKLRWESTATGGKMAAISIKLSEATGSRLGILVSRLPLSAVLRIYPAESDTVFEISGKEVLETLQRNVDADDRSDAARIFWAPFVKGEQVTLELELPAGVSPKALEIAIPRVTHFFASPDTMQASNGVGASANCEVDVSCYSSWSDVSNATAKLSYVDNWGDGFICSGTLLNNKAVDFTPYFLTANHCISSQTEASSLETYWFYRSTGCNSGVPSGNSQTVTGGATLLYAGPSTDTSFLRLNKAPPAGAVFAAWWAAPPTTIGTAITGVHHPVGDLQKISFGSVQAYQDCYLFANSNITCYGATQAGSSHFQVGFTAGITEPGSSGSGLYATVGGSHYLIGQLTGGSTTCNNAAASDYYGRFDQAYTAKLKEWLDGSGCPEVPIHRYRNTQYFGHYYTSNFDEGSAMIAAGAPLQYEGVAFTACSSAGSSSHVYPVYRFKSLVQNGIYFYTMDSGEANYVRTLTNLIREDGIAFYAYGSNAAGRVPVYRFRNSLANLSYFYTAVGAEKDSIVNSLPVLVFEGVSYYAMPPR